ncbi:2'-5' RNA ligase family protein [Paraburkholderia sp.]|uniref:2'-5' RNA ligase family protein n=1 Tax=Paraburkholderia sp. TaxID=1926495 RepID=UPI003D6F39BE
MTTQLMLEGFDHLPVPTDRLFFAIRPDEHAATRIEALVARLREGAGLTARPIARDRLHITLFWLGDHVGLPQKFVDALSVIASSVDSVPFDVEFDRVEYFARRAGKKPLVLRGAASAQGVAALAAFQRTLAAHLGGYRGANGRPIAGRGTSFTPHVTLLYDSLPVQRQAVQTIGWPVREFLLVHSVLGESRHEVLGRWPLRGGESDGVA